MKVFGRDNGKYAIMTDEEMPAVREAAELIDVIEGEDNVERMDGMLSLAITGGDYEWL